MSTEPTYLVLLNELSLPRLLYLVLRKRRIFLIEAPAVLPPMAGYLRRLAERLVARGRCRQITDFDDHLASYKEARVPRHFRDAFRTTEPWLAGKFQFDNVDQWLGDDGYPFRHVTCNHVFQYFNQIHLLRHACENISQVTGPGRNGVVVCTSSMIEGLYRAVFGEDIALRVSRPSRILGDIFKLLALALTWGAIVRGALRNVHWRAAAPRHYFMGADYTGYRKNNFDASLWREFSPNRDRLLQIFRSEAHRRNNKEETENHPSDYLGGGWFTPGEAAWAMISTLGKTLIYIRRLWFLDPLHFRTSLTIPYKRMLYRKLLRAYSFDVFWGNDDYNFDHIVRSQELRRRGILSMGAPHGLPIPTALVPMWRYVDYDRYYICGMGIYKYYADTWPRHMTVSAIGSLGMTRERQARLAEPKPANIIFQTKVEWDFLDAPQRELLAGLATTFPDKRIYLQVKGSFSHTSYANDFVGWGCATFPNVVHSDEHITDLFFKARYLVTDPSTIAAEAIQFGLASFLMDFDDRTSLYFRDFEGLCYKTPGEILDRIKGVEDGTYRYPRESFGELINLSGRNPFDILRKDMEQALPVSAQRQMKI